MVHVYATDLTGLALDAIPEHIQPTGQRQGLRQRGIDRCGAAIPTFS
ncbi:hypothetical protein GCM10009099_18310 [Caenispirillum bisanense]